MNKAAVQRMLVFVLFIAVGAMLYSAGSHGASLNCTIVPSASCTKTAVLYLENESGGYYNAHAENVSIAGYNNAVCCDADAVSDTITVGCEDTTFLKLSGTSNAHVQQPSVDSYSVDACISANLKDVSCDYRTSCFSNESCLVSMASSEGDNTTNAHVSGCDEYDTKVCCAISDGCVIDTYRALTNNLNCSNLIVTASGYLDATSYNVTAFDATVTGNMTSSSGVFNITSTNGLITQSGGLVIGGTNKDEYSEFTIGTGSNYSASSGTTYVWGDADINGDYTHNGGTYWMFSPAGSALYLYGGSVRFYNLNFTGYLIYLYENVTIENDFFTDLSSYLYNHADITLGTTTQSGRITSDSSSYLLYDSDIRAVSESYPGRVEISLSEESGTSSLKWVNFTATVGSNRKHIYYLEDKVWAAAWNMEEDRLYLDSGELYADSLNMYGGFLDGNGSDLHVDTLTFDGSSFNGSEINLNTVVNDFEIVKGSKVNFLDVENAGFKGSGSINISGWQPYRNGTTSPYAFFTGYQTQPYDIADIDFAEGDSWSFSQWVRAPCIGSSGCSHIGQSGCTNSIFWYNNGRITWRDKNSLYTDILDAYSPAEDDWHLIVIASNSSHIKTYVDGSLSKTTTGFSTQISLDYIGDSYICGAGDYAYRGGMDDFRVYSKELSSTDVSDLYSGTAVTDSLVAHWKFDNALTWSGVTSEMIESVGSNHGTSMGLDHGSPMVQLFGGSTYPFKMNGSQFNLNYTQIKNANNTDVFVAYAHNSLDLTGNVGGWMFSSPYNSSATLQGTGKLPSALSTGNLTVLANALITTNNKALNATDTALIVGTLNASSDTADHSFGALTIDSGGIYSATTGATVITLSNLTITGTFTDNEGDIDFRTGQGFGTISTLALGSGKLYSSAQSYWEIDLDSSTYSFSSTNISYGNNTGSNVIDATSAIDGGNNVPTGMWKFSATNVTLISPWNNWYVNDTVISRCKVVNDVTLANVTYYHNNSGTFSANETNSSPGGSTATLRYTVDFPATEKVMVWNCYACDNVSCAFSETNFTVRIDVTPPQSSFQGATPSNNTRQSTSNNFAFVNISSSDASNNISTFVDWNRSLVGWWRFEGSYVDSSSYGNDGTQTNVSRQPEHATGMRGKAYRFDGNESNNDVISVSAVNSYINSSFGTITAWVYPEQQGLNRYIFQSVGSGTNRYYLQWDGDNLNVVRGNPAGTINLDTSTTLNQWHHVGLSWNATHLFGYLNGVLIDTTTYTNPGSSGFGSLIGTQSEGSTFPGIIDEVMVFKRVLSASEMRSLYQSSVNQFYRNFTGLDSGTYTYSAFTVDQAGNLNESEERTFKINIAPGQPSINLTPDIPQTGEDLICNVTTNSTDGDSDAVQYKYEWYKNSVLNWTVSYTSQTTSVLGSGNTSKGESWNCTVTPYDGMDEGTPASDNVTIGNTVPVIVSSRISPVYPNSSMDLVGFCNASDTDSDTFSYHYVWFMNGTVNETGSYSGALQSVEVNVVNISSAATRKGETWILQCMADDGTDNSSALNSSAVVIEDCNPPSTGRWSVDGKEVCRDRDISVDEYVYIQEGDTLVLSNVTLTMAYTGSTGTSVVRVYDGGNLTTDRDTYFTSTGTNSHYVRAYIGGYASFLNTTMVTGSPYARLRVDGGSRVDILNSSFQYNTYFYGDSKTVIKNSYLNSPRVYVQSGQSIVIDSLDDDEKNLYWNFTSPGGLNINVSNSDMNNIYWYVSEGYLNLSNSDVYWVAHYNYDGGHTVLTNTSVVTLVYYNYQSGASVIFSDLPQPMTSFSKDMRTGTSDLNLTDVDITRMYLYSSGATSTVINSTIYRYQMLGSSVNSLINSTITYRAYFYGTSQSTVTNSNLESSTYSRIYDTATVNFTKPFSSVDALDLYAGTEKPTIYGYVNFTDLYSWGLGNTLNRYFPFNVTYVNGSGAGGLYVTIKNGSTVINNGTTDSSGIVSLNISADHSSVPYYNYSVYLNGVFKRNITMLTNTAPYGILLGANSPPTQPTINLTPDNPATTSDLYCNITSNSSDSDGDSITYKYEWYKNSVLNWTVDYVASASIKLGSGNTSKGESWNCTVTPYDGIDEGTPASDAVTVGNTPPGVVNLSYPTEGDEFFTNRTPTFNWTNATDADGDTLTYRFQLSVSSDMSGPIADVTGIIDDEYPYPTELDFTQYFWRVQANDSINNGSWSETWNFTVVTAVSISLTNSNVNFGAKDINEVDNTTDSVPAPFKIENDGNVEANVSVKSTALWDNVALDTKYFQFKANNSDESGSFSSAQSATDWVNISDSYKHAVGYLNHSNANDVVSVDVAIIVPSTEPPESKSANITFLGEIA